MQIDVKGTPYGAPMADRRRNKMVETCMMNSIRTFPLRPMHISPDRASISIWMKLCRSGLMLSQVVIHMVTAHFRASRRVL